MKRDLKRELERIRREAPGDRARFDFDRLARNIAKQRAELAAFTARVTKAEANLAKSLNREVARQLPTSASGEKQWTDPIISLRSQWNINDKWLLAGKGDIGGFGVSSDFSWTLQDTVGYNLTNNVSPPNWAIVACMTTMPAARLPTTCPRPASTPA